MSKASNFPNNQSESNLRTRLESSINAPYKPANIPYRRTSPSARSSSSSISPVTSLDLPRNYIPLSRPDQTPRWLEERTGQEEWQVGSVLRAGLSKVPMLEWLQAILQWMSGPPSRRKHNVTSIFNKTWQHQERLLSRRLPGYSNNLGAVIIFVCWLSLFAFTLNLHLNRPSSAVRLACETRLWPNSTFCGLDGRACEPFENSSFTFSCPANCASVQVLEPHTIGNEEIIYRSKVIGGPAPNSDETHAFYRGDSFICASAIHAGVIDNARGGCGILERQGLNRHFSGSIRNGISSLEFEPSFPLSYSLESTQSVCSDPQWYSLLISYTALLLTSLWTNSGSVFFASSIVIVFFQVALASDPPFSPDFAGVLSLAFERFLPIVFISYTLYRFYIRHTLQGLDARFEKTILWLGGCWIGALNNYTFDKIPISRLTSHDLRQQPGAIAALVIIILLIAISAIYQAWLLRSEGRLLNYVGLYLSLGVLMIILAAIPGLQLRLHHYIIALLLIPGTAVQSKSSLLFQGILIGLFLNGVARWGFASILQTAEALREDGQLGSFLPLVLSPVVQGPNITFTMPSLIGGFDGISVLVNDVERHQSSRQMLPSAFSWSRSEPEDPVFFRFAFTATKPLGGIWYGDYTKPGTWFANGTWKHPLPGPSK